MSRSNYTKLSDTGESQKAKQGQSTVTNLTKEIKKQIDSVAAEKNSLIKLQEKFQHLQGLNKSNNDVPQADFKKIYDEMKKHKAIDQKNLEELWDCQKKILANRGISAFFYRDNQKVFRMDELNSTYQKLSQVLIDSLQKKITVYDESIKALNDQLGQRELPTYRPSKS